MTLLGWRASITDEEWVNPRARKAQSENPTARGLAALHSTFSGELSQRVPAKHL